jgi:DNA invertase Pin-like site-specific DNA recombinase
MSTKPVAVMLRISDEDQSHASQKLEVDRWLAREGIDLAKVEWYVETATGRNLDRPEFARLEADIKARKRRTVVVYALDRISRDVFDGMAVIGRWLKHEVRICSVCEAIDLSGEIGQAVAAFIFAMASGEWKRRKERQAAGIEIAKREGVYKGSKPGHGRKGKPDRAHQLRKQGLTIPEIASAMAVSTRTVDRYLASTLAPISMQLAADTASNEI